MNLPTLVTTELGYVSLVQYWLKSLVDYLATLFKGKDSELVSSHSEWRRDRVLDGSRNEILGLNPARVMYLSVLLYWVAFKVRSLVKSKALMQELLQMT
jgi:hypothetical protein